MLWSNSQRSCSQDISRLANGDSSARNCNHEMRTYLNSARVFSTFAPYARPGTPSPVLSRLMRIPDVKDPGPIIEEDQVRACALRPTRKDDHRALERSRKPHEPLNAAVRHSAKAMSIREPSRKIDASAEIAYLSRLTSRDCSEMEVSLFSSLPLYVACLFRVSVYFSTSAPHKWTTSSQHSDSFKKDK